MFSIFCKLCASGEGLVVIIEKCGYALAVPVCRYFLGAKDGRILIDLNSYLTVNGGKKAGKFFTVLQAFHSNLCNFFSCPFFSWMIHQLGMADRFRVHSFFAIMFPCGLQFLFNSLYGTHYVGWCVVVFSYKISAFEMRSLCFF